MRQRRWRICCAATASEAGFRGRCLTALETRPDATRLVCCHTYRTLNDKWLVDVRILVSIPDAVMLSCGGVRVAFIRSRVEKLVEIDFLPLRRGPYY